MQLNAKKALRTTGADKEETVAYINKKDLNTAGTEFNWGTKQLTWNDFKGSMPVDANEYTAAATYCGIGFEVNTASKKVSVQVYNTFYPARSWVRHDVQNDAILVHEQGHFDICELFTRKLRARTALSTVTARNIKSAMRSVYKEVDDAYQACQQAYEYETQHGTEINEQQRYTEKIITELRNYNKWKS